MTEIGKPATFSHLLQSRKTYAFGVSMQMLRAASDERCTPLLLLTRPSPNCSQAKKLDEIHAEAHAELGMMPALAMASLPPLPGLAQLGPARPVPKEQEVELFPAFKGAEDGGWQVRAATVPSEATGIDH